MKALVLTLLVAVLIASILAALFTDDEPASLGHGATPKAAAPFNATANPSPSEQGLWMNFELIRATRLPKRAKPRTPNPRRGEYRAASAGAIPDLIRSVFGRFGANVAEQAVRVAGCESHFDPTVVNASGHTGLFQLSSRYHQGRAARLGYSWAQMREALPNITVAADLYGETHSWQAWTCKP